MKIGFYTPYLDVLGGGEKYLLTIAQYLSVSHEVDLFWNDENIINRIRNWSNLNLGKISLVPNIFTLHANFSKYHLLQKYDLFFYVTDGSLFFSPAKKNVLIIQVPDRKMYHRSFLNKLKLSRWKIQLCYSQFVKDIIDPWWGTHLTVLPPAIETDFFQGSAKENIILNVGRFFPSPHCKKQDFLVSAFKKMIDWGLSGWRLILCGGVDKKGEDYLRLIKNLVKDYPIEIYPNIDLPLLKEFYGKASIYWHATGAGEDLEKFPQKAEHFGITTLEAMSAGAVPVVYQAGGQIEIVHNQINGFFWKTEDELISLTHKLIQDSALLKNISQQAIIRSKDFSKERFCREIGKIMEL